MRSLLLTLLFLCACTDPLASARKAAAQKQTRAAEEALGAGDLQRAVAAAELAARYDPLDPKLVDQSTRASLALVASACPNVQPDQLARAAYLAEVLAQSDAAWAHVYLTVRAYAAFARNDLPGARKLADEAVTKNAAYGPAELALTLVLDAQGDKAAALAAVSKATEAMPEHTLAAGTRGKLLVENGDYATAIDTLRAVSQRADSAGVRLNLGFALAKAGQPGQAVAEYQRATALEPRNAAAHFRLGETLLELGRLDTAEAAFRNAAALGAEPWATRGLGNIYAKRGDHKAALSAFELVLKARPDELETLFLAAEQYEALGEKAQAAALYGRFAANAGTVPDEKGRAAIARDRAARLTPQAPTPPAR